jgi:hypothetical protein
MTPIADKSVTNRQQFFSRGTSVGDLERSSVGRRLRLVCGNASTRKEGSRHLTGVAEINWA